MRRDFISFQSDDKLDYIVRAFVKNHITSAPVFDNNEFVGIVSDMDLVRYFIPKKYLGLWKKRDATPVEQLKKFIVGKAVRKPRLKLNPEQELTSVLKKIVSQVNCIPVLEKDKLVGIVRSEDMSKLFLKEFAKHSYDKEFEEVKEESGLTSTELDRILETVNKEGKISIKEISKRLGTSVKTAEKLGECLHEHHLVDMKYSFFGGAELRRVNYEKK